MKEINVLLTSSGRRSYLVKYFSEALKSERAVGSVHTANNSPVVPSFLVSDHSVVTPMIYHEDYIPFLLEYCEKNRITAVMSLLDTDLPVLASNRERFEAIGTQLLVADYEKIQICNDKYRTYRFLTENGVFSPRTYLSPEIAVEKLCNGDLSYPVVIKPRWGTGSISVMTANDEEELRVFYRAAKERVMDSFLSYESAQNLEECVVIQEMLHGQEYGLDVINDLGGRFVSAVVKLKKSMRSGETDCAITVENNALYEIGKKLSALINHPALLDVDAFLVDGIPYILEMNARFGGGYPFSHVAGADVPRAIIRWLMGRTVESAMVTARKGVMSQKDIRMIQYK